ncbi:molybdopterin-dependent oxidoreductase [Magnetospirillum sp. UT-4]|uniref:molybdopterin-containing oxidoreductase family protein n=1 Tax=Magnetospirillum sp. UT-4 TaxID=2681467 RepID=UPI001572D661|nr:molybdopterin oxidoreductase family protein [Magnetospirillum sp. UT-4]
MTTAATHATICPHDCPSACALEVERLADGRIGKVRGGALPYTDGAICAKVSRYAELVHHPERVLHPLKRIGAKGEGRFARVSWDEALDTVAAKFGEAADRHGPEAVWPYFYAGTMGLVQNNATNRLRRAMGYSGQAKTICATIAGAGWMAGVGAKWGVDVAEMAGSEVIVIWGSNPVATQMHLMGLIMQAKRERGARLVVIDPYRSPTAEKADLHLMPLPGTDAALACGVMHVLFRDGLVDRDYMARFTDGAERLEAHLALRNPGWAGDVCGLPSDDIEAFARLYGSTRKSFLRIGYGMSRQRNGAANVHAVSCLPALTGAWAQAGGGAALSTSGAFAIDRTVMDALDLPEPKVRVLDMSRIGPILCGDSDALKGGPPVTAMLVQSSNPATVAPDSGLVQRGLARDDLFLVVHEQTMTRTARFADIVLPATTFLEHDDLYSSYGHTFLQAGRAVIPPLGEARSNHRVVGELARRLGAGHASFGMDEAAMIEGCLAASGLSGLDELCAKGWIDCALSFERQHFLDGFGHGGRFRFAPDWAAQGPDHAGLPPLPDHVPNIEAATPEHPFRLITPPSRHFLNTSFTKAPTSRRLAGRPTALIHAEDCARLGIAAGDPVRLGNARGSVLLHAAPTDGIARGVVAVEGIWDEESFAEGNGINLLVGSDPVPPAGGGAFHDTAVWVRREPRGTVS